MSLPTAFVRALNVLATAAVIMPGLASAAVVRTPLGPPHEVTLAELLGRSPVTVREALAAGSASWPLRYVVEIAEQGGGERAFIPMNSFLQDAAAQEIVDRARTGGPDLPTEWTQCAVKRSDVQTTSEVDDTYTSLLEFRRGRLAAIWIGRFPKKADLVSLLEGDRAMDFPSASELSALPVTTRLTAACTRHTIEPTQPLRRPPPDYNWPQALIGIPLVPALHLKNARRSAARRDGEALYNTLTPGSTLPPAMNGFGRGDLVQVESASGSDSAVYSIDLGAYPGRNLTAPDDYGLVGVRQGRVVWRFRSEGY